MHVVIKYIPKGTHFCQTICGEGRVMTACAINSIGMDAFYTRLYDRLGIRMQQPTKRFCERTDEVAKYRKYRSELPTSKAIRKRKEYENLRDQIEKDKQGRLDGTFYKTRCMVKKKSDTTGKTSPEGVVVTKTKSGCCKWCGLSTHQRKSSKLCPYNPNNVEMSTSGKDPKISRTSICEPAMSQKEVTS